MWQDMETGAKVLGHTVPGTISGLHTPGSLLGMASTASGERLRAPPTKGVRMGGGFLGGTSAQDKRTGSKIWQRESSVHMRV